MHTINVPHLRINSKRCSARWVWRHVRANKDYQDLTVDHDALMQTTETH